MDALENLEVWNHSCQLSVQLCKVLSDCKDRGFKDQITRVALSIPSNIAEGNEWDSLKSCVQYLKIAKGSSGERGTQLLIGRKIGFIDSETGKYLELEAKNISNMLYGWIEYYKSSHKPCS